MAQLHNKFTDDQVKELIARYMNREIERKYIQEILGIGKTRLFPCSFSIQYTRKTRTRAIAKSVEKNILKELSIEKKLIKDKDVPLNSYNFTYIKDRLEGEYKQKASLPTVIKRANEHGFYLKKLKRKAHDRTYGVDSLHRGVDPALCVLPPVGTGC